MAKTKNMDERITDILAEGPLASMYFVAGINALKEKTDAMSDDDLYCEFAGLLAPSRIRGNINHIYKQLNKIKTDEK